MTQHHTTDGLSRHLKRASDDIAIAIQSVLAATRAATGVVVSGELGPQPLGGGGAVRNLIAAHTRLEQAHAYLRYAHAAAGVTDDE